MRNESYNGYNPDDPLYLCFCGYENCPSGHFCAPHIRDSYLIHYMISGSCQVTIESNTYIANSGDYFIIPPSKLVSYKNVGSPMSYYWFGYNGKKADEFYKNSLAESVIIHASHKEETVSLIKDCLQELKKNNVNQMRITGNLYLLLSLLEGESTRTNNALHKNDAIIEQALSYIHHNYMKQRGLTVTEIANYLNVERTTFSKIFKAKVGINAIEYISNCQIDKALELIRTTDLPFNEISNICGICDQYYFTKLIKKRTNLTPSNYRKAHKK